MNQIRNFLGDIVADIQDAFPQCFSRRHWCRIVFAVFVVCAVIFVLVHLKMARDKKTIQAYNLARQGVTIGQEKLLESVENWRRSAFEPLPGYNFDRIYDVPGVGAYIIRISVDPSDSRCRIVEAVGKDTGSNLRGIRTVYISADSPIFALGSVGPVILSSSTLVEWGPILSYGSIMAKDRTSPRTYSAAAVRPQSKGDVGESTWWAYHAVPRMDSPDLLKYRDAALAAGKSPCGFDYFVQGDKEFRNCRDTSGNTYYITGNVSFVPGGAGNFIKGNVIAHGTLSVSGNGGGSGVYNTSIPKQAWKEYSGNWIRYTSFDRRAPAAYSLAVSQNYRPDDKAVYHLEGVLVNGFVYAGSGIAGLGDGVIHGVLVSGGQADLSKGNGAVYFDNVLSAQVPSSGFTMSQISWKEVQAAVWPPGSQ